MKVTAREVARASSYNLRQLRSLTEFSARGRDAGSNLDSPPPPGDWKRLPGPPLLAGHPADSQI
jgi:hypothetical protein